MFDPDAHLSYDELNRRGIELRKKIDEVYSKVIAKNYSNEQHLEYIDKFNELMEEMIPLIKQFRNYGRTQ